MEKHMMGKKEENRVPEIKICGITTSAEAEYLNESQVDYAGFVIFEKSKRYINCKQARDIFKKLNHDIKKVAVVVSPQPDLIREIEASGFDIVQIHGSLPTGGEHSNGGISLEEIRSCTGLSVWRAINILTVECLTKLPQEPIEAYDALVVDAGDYGSGKTFGWESDDRIIQEFRERMNQAGKKLVLAGGLNPENVGRGIEIFAPDIVDVSSGVEYPEEILAERKKTISEGSGQKVSQTRKDRDKIKAFVRAAAGLNSYITNKITT
jgi:phosphoribosylanthranilate isomerase